MREISTVRSECVRLIENARVSCDMRETWQVWGLRLDTRRPLYLRSANRHYLRYHVSGSTLTAVGRSQLLARWPGTHSRIISGIQRAAQTVLGVYLKRTCSRVTTASSALGVLNDYALYKSTHSLTHLPAQWPWALSQIVSRTRRAYRLFQAVRLKTTVDRR